MTLVKFHYATWKQASAAHDHVYHNNAYPYDVGLHYSHKGNWIMISPATKDPIKEDHVLAIKQDTGAIRYEILEEVV